MKVLVTGAAGFVAWHLINRLLSEGHEVVGVDSFISGQQANVADLSTNKGFCFFEADILALTGQDSKFQDFWRAIDGIQRIYHLACPASPPIYQKDSLHTLDTCYIGSRNILEIAKQQQARMLVSSTSEIYGDPLVHPQPESYRGNVNTVGPRSCYDEGKRVMETLCYIYAGAGVSTRIARIFNTYGPRMSPVDGRVLTNFISQALQGESLTVFGSGKQTRSFCYCADLVDGLIRLMESEVTEPVNLGSQFEFTILDIAEQVRKLINPELQIRFEGLPIDDPKLRRPDARRAEELLGWKPRTSLEIGMQSMIEDFRVRLKIGAS